MSKKPGYTHFYQTMSALLANMVTITTASAAAPIDSTFLPLLTLEQISKCTYLSITTFFGKNTALQGYVSLWSDPLDRPPCYFGSYWASEKTCWASLLIPLSSKSVHNTVLQQAGCIRMKSTNNHIGHGGQDVKQLLTACAAKNFKDLGNGGYPGNAFFFFFLISLDD